MIEPVKIIGICGSPRKAATEYCVKEALQEAQKIEGIEVEYYSLRGRSIHFCVHCDSCLRKGSYECVVYKDDMTELYEPFMNADGYIIGSPVYGMCITGQLQTFFNRFRSTWLLEQEKPGFFHNKVGGSIAVGGTRHGGQEMALSTINNFYFMLGVSVVSGGFKAYNGAAVWSQDKGEEGAKKDEIGMATVRAIGERVAKAAKALRQSNSSDQI